MTIARILGVNIVAVYMGKILSSMDIEDPGLKTLLPEVEEYFVRGGGSSVVEVLPAQKNFYQFCLIVSATLISPLFSGFK